MSASLRVNAACVVLLSVALTTTGTPALAQESDTYEGRPLVDVLRSLQARGLRIVFSSATVTPDLRVLVEPRAASARQQLDELLAPHGLVAREGPGGTIQILRGKAAVAEPRATHVGTIEGRVVDALTTAPLAGAVVRIDGATADMRTDDAGRFVLRRVDAGARLVFASMTGYAPDSRAVHVTGGRTVVITLILPPIPVTHREYVSVSRTADHRADNGVASKTNLDRSELERLHGSLADDPVRVVHAFPRVTAIDEFQSEFAVRGSPFRHINLVVDGVATQWLQHTAQGRAASGSLPMLAGPVLDNVTLRAGAYPRRHGDRLGPQLDLTIREGSRAEFALRGAVGGTNATLLGEGPVGSSARGSWLVALRQSYLEWPTERRDSTRTPFGFFDGLAKVVYDVRATQQVGLTAVAGMSTVDEEDNLTPNELGNGFNRASVLNLSWRSTFGSAAVLTQRVYAVRHRFLNKYQDGEDSDRGANTDTAYRADITRRVGRGLLESGLLIGRTTLEDAQRSPKAGAIAGSSWTRSGYLHFTWAASPALTISPGVRVMASTLVPHSTVSEWLLGEWSFRRGWTLSVSGGLSQQAPELRQVLGEVGSRELRPERARHFDAGIEQRLTKSIRWQATVFSRNEGDIVREPSIHPRLVDGALVSPERERYTNALEGSSRGIELLIQRRNPRGLSGWAAYSYGKTRYHDPARAETYWGDFDQRHSLNLFGAYRLSPRTSVGATFRGGSNFPIPGYFAAGDGRLFAGNARNLVRLPYYARLDVRGDRQLEYFGRRLTLFVELLNVLNRANVGLVRGSINPTTGEAIDFTDSLFKRHASAGIVVDF